MCHPTMELAESSAGAMLSNVKTFTTRAEICAVCRYRARCGYEGERELCQAREQDVREEERCPQIS